jgi:multiple sugar transport system substrate-binding protein
VTVKAEAMAPGDDADVGVLPFAELGAWADRGDLAPVPVGLRAADHPVQWTGLLPEFREQLIDWGGQAHAVPLAGDGYVIVYRSDRLADANFAAAFRAAHGRDPGPPATWEEFADLAAALSASGKKPSLPALTAGETADLFFRVAACYDRPALNEVVAGAQGGGALGFQHDLTSAEPRLGEPGFRAAADWLAGLAARKCLPPAPPAGGSDPAGALDRGDASLAVLSLSQLGKLAGKGGAVRAEFALAPLPGTRMFLDPQKRQMTPAAVPNYVPYFAGGRLGVVRTRCPRTDAAFDLLAELAGPARSQEVLSAPGLGAGPFRSVHLERNQLHVWFGYGLDPDRTRALQDALRQYTRTEVKNAVYGLRGPDQAELNAAAADAAGKIASGALTAEAGLKALREAWQKIDEKTPKDARLRWRRLAAGVN